MNKTVIKTVKDGKLSNEQLGLLTRRHDEIKRRVCEGTLSYETVLDGYQNIIENRFCHGAPMFTITTRGESSEQGLVRLGKNGFLITKEAREEIGKLFFSGQAGSQFLLGIIFAQEFSSGKPNDFDVRREAKRRGWFSPPAEIALDIREKISHSKISALGLDWLSIMHEPIVSVWRKSSQFALGREKTGENSGKDYLFLDMSDIWPYTEINRGFVFVVPEFTAK
jgi:hypothetical protein